MERTHLGAGESRTDAKIKIHCNNLSLISRKHMNMPCKMYKDKRITKQRSADSYPFTKKTHTHKNLIPLRQFRTI